MLLRFKSSKNKSILVTKNQAFKVLEFNISVFKMSKSQLCSFDIHV